MPTSIARCCEIKADVVSQDETEGGLRAILNFGHTIGHAIENSSGYGKFLHGEAIAIGQVAAAKLSHRILGLSSEDVARIEKMFSPCGIAGEDQTKSCLAKTTFCGHEVRQKSKWRPRSNSSSPKKSARSFGAATFYTDVIDEVLAATA